MDVDLSMTQPVEPPAAPRRSAFVVLGLGLGLVAVALVVAVLVNRTNGEHQGSGPVVGGDLHAVFTVGERTFVSGHSGAGYSDEAGVWVQIPSLDNKDAMGWAQTATELLVGGHGGLYLSTDDGASFNVSTAVPEGTDVHALGASGGTVYLSTPGQGLYVSADGAATFERRGEMPALMGTILVDPNNPDLAVAADMQSGAVQTVDGGRSWASLGGPTGAMSVARDPTDARELVVIGMEEAAISGDGGTTWRVFDVPPATVSATYSPAGILIAGVLRGDHSATYRLVDGKWTSAE